MNESELLRRLSERDPEALRSLHEQYVPTLWRTIYTRVSGDSHLAEDLVHETMLALLRFLDDDATNRPVEREIQSLGGWLHTVAERKVNDHFRVVARVRHLIEGVGHVSQQNQQAAEEDANPLNQQIQAENRAQIRTIMDSLPAPQRQVLHWKYLDELSVREIAERLGTTEKAVESLLYRARLAFRDQAVSKDIAKEATRSIHKPPLGPVPCVDGGICEGGGE